MNHEPYKFGSHPSPHRSDSGHGKGHYGRLAAMIGLSFLAMFFLMYAMVDALKNVVPNLNQAYMAALMTAPMVMLELVFMGAMYSNKRVNGLIWGLSILTLFGSWFLIREQTLIGDRQFLRSMIPHHAGAILMCEEGSLRDARVLKLCEGIVSSQTQEIAEMKVLLEQPDLN